MIDGRIGGVGDGRVGAEHRHGVGQFVCGGHADVRGSVRQVDVEALDAVFRAFMTIHITQGAAEHGVGEFIARNRVAGACDFEFHHRDALV